MAEMLIEEAAKKAAVAWLTVPGAGSAYLVWTTWLDGALLIVSGPGEQQTPGLERAEALEVSLRGDHGGRIVDWPARVSTVNPTSDLLPQLAAKRLNGAGTTDEVVRRWGASNVVYRLDPDGGTEPLPDGSLAEAARPSPATRLPRKPFKLHRVRKRS